MASGSPIVVAGTGLNVRMAKEPPSDMGKPFTQMQPLLPVLKSDDVRARLSRMLEVSSQDLDQCENLYMRSEEHTSELQSLMRISYAVFCLKKKKSKKRNTRHHITPASQHE